jgi:putative glutamine transport system permease protein
MTAATVTRPGRRLRIPWPVRLVVALAGLAAVVALLVTVGFLPSRNWSRFLDPSSWRFLAQGLGVTALIGGVALVASLIISVPLALGRLGLPPPLRIPLVLWIDGIRATPVLAILFIVFFGLPRLGVDLTGIQAATIGLTIYTSAVLSEIVRAGVLSIPRGEVEAARSLGLTYGQTMRRIVLPQALSRMAPAIVSQLITLVKDTSLASILAVQELVGSGRVLFNFYGNPIETLFVVACIYFAICYSLSQISRRLEAGRAPAERVAVAGEEDQIPAR